MHKYDQISRFTYVHLAITLGFLAVQIYLNYLIATTSQIQWYSPAMAVASVGFSAYMTWRTHRNSHRFYAQMARYNIPFEYRREHIKMRKCQNCGNIRPCINYCERWRCMEDYHGFRQYWKARVLRDSSPQS